MTTLQILKGSFYHLKSLKTAMKTKAVLLFFTKNNKTVDAQIRKRIKLPTKKYNPYKVLDL